jgi:hypothetical protein
MVFEFRQWGIFPPELYLLLLECLNCIDETAQGSVAILGVSLLSHSHYELVTSWVSRVAEEEILTMKELESKGNMPPTRNERPRTCLAIFCKKLSGICAVCNCRKETHELFTGIQLCQTCDALFFPKISLTRFNELFRATVLGQEKARDRKFRYRTQRTAGSDVAGLERQEPGPIFRWVDLQCLFSEAFTRDDITDKELVQETQRSIMQKTMDTISPRIRKLIMKTTGQSRLFGRKRANDGMTSFLFLIGMLYVLPSGI